MPLILRDLVLSVRRPLVERGVLSRGCRGPRLTPLYPGSGSHSGWLRALCKIGLFPYGSFLGLLCKPFWLTQGSVAPSPQLFLVQHSQTSLYSSLTLLWLPEIELPAWTSILTFWSCVAAFSGSWSRTLPSGSLLDLCGLLWSPTWVYVFVCFVCPLPGVSLLVTVVRTSDPTGPFTI